MHSYLVIIIGNILTVNASRETQLACSYIDPEPPYRSSSFTLESSSYMKPTFMGLEYSSLKL